MCADDHGRETIVLSWVLNSPSLTEEIIDASKLQTQNTVIKPWHWNTIFFFSVLFLTCYRNFPSEDDFQYLKK